MEWHKRFVQQAAWTSELRLYLFERAGMKTARKVLEVGCGTGAILSSFTTCAAVHGLDLEHGRLVEARQNAPMASLTCADALWLPYASDVFDITFCHYFLLWANNPLQALREMKRVTRPGGSILALAEPDYLPRVDKPEALVPLGRRQAESLRQQGADPGLGSRLAEMFRLAGIRLVESGLLQAKAGPPPAREERDLEWAVLEDDLVGLVPTSEMQRLRRLDDAAWEHGVRVLYVPTYWCFGISA